MLRRQCASRALLQWSHLMHIAAAQVNSFRNQVLFRTAATQIPDGAILLEVGPHAVLRALLRQNRCGGSPALHAVGNPCQCCHAGLCCAQAAEYANSCSYVLQ